MLSHMQLISFHAFSQALIITCYYTCNSSHLMLFTIFHQHMLSHMPLISSHAFFTIFHQHILSHMQLISSHAFHNLSSTHVITHATHLISIHMFSNITSHNSSKHISIHHFIARKTSSKHFMHHITFLLLQTYIQLN